MSSSLTPYLNTGRYVRNARKRSPWKKTNRGISPSARHYAFPGRARCRGLLFTAPSDFCWLFKLMKLKPTLSHFLFHYEKTKNRTRSFHLFRHIGKNRLSPHRRGGPEANQDPGAASGCRSGRSSGMRRRWSGRWRRFNRPAWVQKCGHFMSSSYETGEKSNHCVRGLTCVAYDQCTGRVRGCPALLITVCGNWLLDTVVLFKTPQ